jgi:hypothetical protein
MHSYDKVYLTEFSMGMFTLHELRNQLDGLQAAFENICGDVTDCGDYQLRVVPWAG